MTLPLLVRAPLIAGAMLAAVLLAFSRSHSAAEWALLLGAALTAGVAYALLYGLGSAPSRRRRYWSGVAGAALYLLIGAVARGAVSDLADADFLMLYAVFALCAGFLAFLPGLERSGSAGRAAERTVHRNEP